VSEFNWGEPHPLAIDRKRRKNETDRRAVRTFFGILSAAGTLYLRDAAGAREALALYDREATNIRYWRAWTARVFAAAADDPFAAEMCRDDALTATELVLQR